MKALVDAAWLARSLGNPGLVVLDATLYMPAESLDAGERFLAGHIPGARVFDIDQIADPEAELPHMVPSPARFARLVAELGVGRASRVVFYDQKGLFSAARGWWLMRLFGHERAAVLDGGLPAWRAAGGAIETGESAAVPPGDFVATWHAGRVRGAGDVLDGLASRAELLVDARAASRFDGSAAEPRAGLRSGHIPGARNLPFTELLRPDQTMLLPDALRSRLAAAGVKGEDRVVTYCGSGVTAAIVTLAMHVAGMPEGAVYDGSWTEWGGRDDTPVET